ncbi:MAG TPA: hypothetical protein VHN11_01780 [Xanthobacteraceae bacterium]|jgi:chemotaxis regulatin CheY-phosphate phosphatase CheZ|nr:hypothetical protein [Xanthobacteraceae bacterium]
MAKPPAPMPLNEADYEAIEAAVMETARGRWFLAEYARRNRHADTSMLLTAIDRLEGAIRGEEGTIRQKQEVDPADNIRMNIVEMANAIVRTKAEISAIKPDSEHHGKFGDATEELDSIVQTTEIATSEILAAAEQIQEVAWTLREQGLDAEMCDLIDTKATNIYIACSFQDITGQRTQKVIHALHFLEERINAMINIWGLEGAMAAEASKTARARDDEAALLNGPARPGQGLEQADVDMVMGPAQVAMLAREDLQIVDIDAHTVVDITPVDITPAKPLIPENTPPTQQAAPAQEDKDQTVEHRPADTVGKLPDVSAAPIAPKSTLGGVAPDPLGSINALTPEEKIALFS